MRVGMEKYTKQYPDADVVLFEPDREDSDMFFANLFSYSQRKKLCSIAFQKTRENLLARAPALEPLLRRHGIAIRHDRLHDQHRSIRHALTDPRPLHPNPARSPRVKQAARDLSHTLDQLERALVQVR
jgi:hypothetical protein